MSPASSSSVSSGKARSGLIPDTFPLCPTAASTAEIAANVKPRIQQTIIMDAPGHCRASGRPPKTEGLGLERIGLELNNRGQIETDHDFRTKVDGVWAVGDVIPGPMLAHKAEDEGIAVAENIAGQHGIVNHAVIPSVVYTWPEIASVGMSEQEAKDAGREFKVGKFPFSANGRARSMGATEGFVKFIADARTDEILGCHMIGANVSDLLSEVVLAMEFRGTAEDIGVTVHSHPTLSEVVKEAALGALGRAVHI